MTARSRRRPLALGLAVALEAACAGPPGVIPADAGAGSDSVLLRDATIPDARAEHVLYVLTSGGGRITSTPAGIDCGDECALSVAEDTDVTLAAIPTDVTAFASWAGGCTGNETCRVQVSSETIVGAHFTPPVHVWSHRLGAAGEDVARAIAIAVGDDIVVTGGFSESVDFGGGTLLTASGASDVFLARYEADGTLRWARAFPCAVGCSGTAVAVDGRGDILLAGTTLGAIDLGGGVLAAAGDIDVFVAKVSAAGEHLWARVLGGPGRDRAFSLAVDAAGDTLTIAGSFEVAADLGGPLLVSQGGADAFVARISGIDGGHLWSRGLGGSGTLGPWGDAASAVVVDAGGDVLVSGWFEGAADLGGETLVSSGAGGDVDAFAAKYEGLDGVHLWSKGFGGGGDDMARGIAAGADGDVTITGGFQYMIDFGGGRITATGIEDLFLARLRGGDGAHVWSRGLAGGALSSTAISSGTRVAVDATGASLVTGWLKTGVAGPLDFGGETLGSPGWGEVVFLAAYDGGGGLRWVRRYGRVLPSEDPLVALMAGGDVALAGGFSWRASFGGAVLSSAGFDDIYVARLRP